MDLNNVIKNSNFKNKTDNGLKRVCGVVIGRERDTSVQPPKYTGRYTVSIGAEGNADTRQVLMFVQQSANNKEINANGVLGGSNGYKVLIYPVSDYKRIGIERPESAIHYAFYNVPEPIINGSIDTNNVIAVGTSQSVSTIKDVPSNAQSFGITVSITNNKTSIVGLKKTDDDKSSLKVVVPNKTGQPLTVRQVTGNNKTEGDYVWIYYWNKISDGYIGTVNKQYEDYVSRDEYDGQIEDIGESINKLSSFRGKKMIIVKDVSVDITSDESKIILDHDIPYGFTFASKPMILIRVDPDTSQIVHYTDITPPNIRALITKRETDCFRYGLYPSYKEANSSTYLTKGHWLVNYIIIGNIPS